MTEKINFGFFLFPLRATETIENVKHSHPLKG